jgi:predicted ABC-type ATPase
MARRIVGPKVIVIAGPNGAGKSTAAPALLRGPLAIDDFVNADVIARGLSAFNSESVAMEAGRIMLQRLHQLAERKRSFAFETTLASRSFAPWIAELVKNSGYDFRLVFLLARQAGAGDRSRQAAGFQRRSFGPTRGGAPPLSRRLLKLFRTISAAGIELARVR